MSDREQLDECLKQVEAGCREYDAGDIGATPRIAGALRAIFHQEGAAGSLLSRLSGTYTKMASTVAKPPYPHGLYTPLTDITIELGASTHTVSSFGNAGGINPPRLSPRLGRPDRFRHVQAPDWWKSEPAFLVDHSKVTRRDVVVWAASGQGPDASPLTPLLVKAKLTGLRGAVSGGFHTLVPTSQAHAAAVRQIGHEVLNSPELLTLAGRSGK
jgi:hypothetical protein